LVPVVSNAQAVRTVLLANAIQVRLTPARLTNASNHFCLAVMGSSGNRDITDNAP
jgi:hypothetical protein